MTTIKYLIKIIFLALADISMCECYNNRNDKLESYYKNDKILFTRTC